MGADQSSPVKVHKNDGTSSLCDTNKPIDTTSSPSLMARARTAKSKTSPRGKPHDIVVVSEGASKESNDEELEKLNSVPSFLPLLKSSLPSSKITLEQEHLEKLNSQELLALSSRYQEHLQQCAEAVAFDQNAVCVRIKEVDANIATLYTTLSERQKRFAKYAEHIQKVQDVQTSLNKVKYSLQQTLPLLEYLNSVLPAEKQLEPFKLDEAASHTHR